VSYASALGFGESVRRLREEQGLSLKALGGKTGRCWSAIWKIEKGESGARLDTALAIAGALGTTLEAMIAAPGHAVAGAAGGGPGFGPSVRRERLARGWNIQALADRTGLPRTTIIRIELGQVTPTLTVAAMLASPLESSITALAGTGDDRG
jgi:transcriptional regulator with XRE-family HTH domain